MPEGTEPALDATRDPVPSTARHGRWWRLGLLVAIIVGAVVLGRALGLARYTQPAVLRQTVEDLRHLRWIVPGFVAAYALGASIGLPATPFTFTGAALFGPWLGSLCNWIGATLGATGSFLLARTLGHGALADFVRRRAPRMDALVAEHGFATVLRLRLIPVFPYNALNLGAGLAGMRLLPYVVATAFGMLPAIIVYTILGDALADGATGGGRQAFVRAAIAGGALLLLSFVPAIVTRVRGKRSPGT